MKLPSLIEQAFSREDYEAIESDWLLRTSEDPTALVYFAAVAQALSDHGQDERVQMLLELLDDQLREQALWPERLELIKSSGKLYLKAGKVHDTVLASLESMFSDAQERFPQILSMVGLDKGRDGATKIWDKVERIKSLMAYEVGCIVAMEGKGVGKVVGVNLELQTLKIDFERQNGISVGFRAAGKLLQILPKNHILRRKVDNLEELAALDPPELLRITLQSHDKALTGGEIREALAGVVEPTKWSSWWAAARKHPQVLVTGGGRHSYAWANTSENAQDVHWQLFEKAKPSSRIDLYRRAGNQDGALRERMAEALLASAIDVVESDPALAFEISSLLDRTVELPAEVGATAIITGLRDPAKFFETLRNRALRQQGYETVRAQRDDWPDVFATALQQETDPKNLDLLANALEEEDPKRFAKVIDQLMSQPSRAPASFVWLAERSVDDAALRDSKPLKFIRQLLAATSDDSFASFRSRLEPLVETGGALPRALAALSVEEAAEAEEAMERANGLESYQRDALVTALHVRFPSLRREQEHPLYTTAASLELKRLELKTLLEDEIPANRRAIEEARAMGDLRENFEYKSARQRHEYLASRASQLHSQLGRAQVLDPSAIDPSKIRVGTRVRLVGADGSRDLTVLGPWESHPDGGVVSYESDLAKGLLGKKVGDDVDLSGTSYVVDEIVRFE